MPTLEEMREAILELSAARERERKARDESEAILGALRIAHAAPSPDAAVTGLLDVLRDRIGCRAAVLLRQDAAGHAVMADLSTDAALLGRGIPLAPDLAGLFAGGPRRIFELSEKDWWRAAPPAWQAAFRSLLVAPVALGGGRPAALACFGARAARFTKDHERLLSRIAGVAAQSVAMLELSERNRLLATVVERAAAAFAVADARDPARPVLFVNEAFERITGKTRASAIGAPLADLADAAEPGRDLAAFREAVEAGEVADVSLVFHPGTAAVGALATVYPVADRDGSPAFVVASLLDVSSEREIARERDEARDRLVSALEATPEAVLVADHSGRVVLANQRYRDLFPEQSQACVPGADLREVFAIARALDPDAGDRAGSGRDQVEERIGRLYRGGEREEELADGRVLLVSERRTADGGAILVATDITRLKAIERLLAHRAAAMDAASDGIAITDRFGRFLYMNLAHARLFGHDSPVELIGSHWSRLYGPEQRRMVEEVAFATLARSGAWQGELRGLRRDGRAVFQDVSLTVLDGVGVICVTRDAGERKRIEAERARLTEQLHEAQRREAVGQLAAGIAHDFNNLLSAIGGSAALLARIACEDAGARPHVERIETAVARASDLVRRLLSIGRRGGRPGRIDLARPVLEAVEIARTAVPDGVRLVASVPD